MKTLTNPRAIACSIIHQITQHKDSLASLDITLQHYSLTEQNRRLVYLLCYGVFRQFFYLEYIFNLQAQGKTKPKVRLLAMIGLYQIIFMHKPLHASINETVSACDELNVSNAKSFINALLRQIDKASLPSNHHFKEFPDWLYGKLKKHYANELDNIITNSNIQPPVFLRLNQQQSPEQVLKALQDNNIGYKTTTIDNCLQLNEAQNINDLPLFSQGFFSVQDHSAQLAAHILAPQTQEKILDACAAPGGKSAHLLELCPDIELTIMDNNAKRFERIKENLARLQLDKLNIDYAIQDASEPLSKNILFDKILIDAPCSATGVIRRNPDIKVLRTPEEVKEIVQIQQRILDNLVSYLKPNGLFLYATCSILPEENDKQMANFLQTHYEFTVVDIPMMDNKLKQVHGYQILPTQNSGDGFYYCLLQKIS
ncbi:16S rRNA (cytosine(967)-C(5))-methyltransferase RsmB [Cysteiniphilum sp. 6C5]|uniref:16S rRNA (cytosine(967)-C(5))-methyltransferase RsmB n=1 Tax=unclassified Cysteiniphilum TaxID=2610889 RepID=UPI003F83E3D7